MPVNLTSYHEPKPERRLTGRMVLAMFVGFFGLIFAANAVMIWMAFDSWTGLEVESSFQAGRHYQSEIDAAKAQAERGWQVRASATRSGSGAAILSVELADKAARAISGLSVAAQLKRPTSQAQDRTIILAEGPAGTYAGRVDNVADGQWTLVLDAMRDGERVFRSRNSLVLGN